MIAHGAPIAEASRNGLLERIPATAQRILLLGKVCGALGSAIQARQTTAVHRIEVGASDTLPAPEILDRVGVGGMEKLATWIPEQPYDCIVCPNELAYQCDVGSLLSRVREWLTPGGRFLACLSNVRHHSVLERLLQGQWTYQSPEPDQLPPLRFFTRREIEKLFYRTGFQINQLHAVPGAGYVEWQQRGKPTEVNVGTLLLDGLSATDAEEFYIGEFLVEATPAPRRDHGLTSIVILTHNQLPYTRLCLESIRQRTDEPYELILVDNASEDGTREYLAAQPNAKVIYNPDNRGFPTAVNQGIRASSGRQVLLLNNDTVVTSGWLGRLLHALESDPKVGLVGPCSNCVSGEQQVEVGYDDLAQLDGFAWDWGKVDNRTRQDTDRLVGFCLLIRREVIDQIGLLDARFGIGCFEDDDYCRRAKQAGYRAVIARDAFVHHFGGRTFVASGLDFGALMRTNQQLFHEKWHEQPTALPTPVAASAPPSGPVERVYDVRAAPGGGLLLGHVGIECSLCMIVRDNARTIRPCLESIRKAVDDLVVVDTGSQDETPQIARQLGARVFQFPWCDSFSAARNESLRHARGKWIFWMDSDDICDASNARQLRELVRNPVDPKIMGYVVSVHCPSAGSQEDAEVTIVQHVKLFRNYPQLRFDGRIHEQIIPSICAIDGDIAWTDLFVVHSGYDHSPAGQKRKLERDLRLLHLELDERPDHPFTLFNLAMTYTDAGRFDEGLRYARRCLARSPEGASHVRKAYAYLVCCQERRGQEEAAWQSCLEGLRKFPLDDELRFRKGVLLQGRGRLREAAQAYLELLGVREEVHFGSVVAGIAGHLARHNLALIYRELGDAAREEEQWRQIVAERPRYRPGWRGLGELLVRRGNDAEVRILAQRLMQEGVCRSEGRMLLSALAGARGDRETARGELERAIAECPEDTEPLQALCQLLFEHGDPQDAELALRQLVHQTPDNASAHHNLGTVYLRLQRTEAAIKAYRQSLQQRPASAETHLHLGYALQAAGRQEEARAAWQEALKLDPNNRSARKALGQPAQSQ
jgi:GT2 family glycosyltransferase/tetratricopeptide (TPR) repeat protein